MLKLQFRYLFIINILHRNFRYSRNHLFCFILLNKFLHLDLFLCSLIILLRGFPIRTISPPKDDSEVQRMLLLKMEKIRDEEIAIRPKALYA